MLSGQTPWVGPGAKPPSSPRCGQDVRVSSATARPHRRPQDPSGAPRSRPLPGRVALLRPRELLVAALLLALLGAAVFVTHIRHGSFELDDWGVLSLVHYPPSHGGALSTLWRYYSLRPGEVAYYAVVDSLLGYHAHAQLALAAALLVGEIVALFALLRMLGLDTLGALFIAGLALVLPRRQPVVVGDPRPRHPHEQQEQARSGCQDQLPISNG